MSNELELSTEARLVLVDNRIDILTRMTVGLEAMANDFHDQRVELRTKAEEAEQDAEDFDPLESGEWTDKLDSYLTDECNDTIEIAGYQWNASDLYDLLPRSTQREVEQSIANDIDKDKFEEYRDLKEAAELAKDKANELDEIWISLRTAAERIQSATDGIREIAAELRNKQD